MRLDGRKLELQAAAGSPAELLIYYKPPGEVTTRRDPQNRPTVFERLPAPAAGRWITVGRLDVNTAGLLLLTTDGELAHRLMHPSGEVPREYLVRLRGRPDAAVLAQLRERRGAGRRAGALRSHRARPAKTGRMSPAATVPSGGAARRAQP